MSMLAEEELANASLLVFANKQDCEGAMSVTEVSEYLALTDLKTRAWTIFKCSAKNGTGLNEGLDWLVNVVSGNK